MTHLHLHTFGSTNGQCNFTETIDLTKRHYDFGVDLSQSFKNKYNTLAKLKQLETPISQTHKKINNKEIWLYCPDCITKIQQELNL